MMWLRRMRASLVCLLVLLTSLQVLAQDSTDGTRFEVSEVKISGLERVAPATVLAAAAFNRGDVIDDDILATTIRRLYETGLFRDIEVSRDGNRVLIDVVENPTIHTIRFEGMTELDEERVLGLLAGRDVAPGRIFKRDTAEFINNGVATFYRQISRYLTTANTVTVPLEGNRVDLVVQVTESEQARIDTIRIHGVEAFSESELLDEIELREGGLFVSLFDRDLFTQEKIDTDLGRLRNYYTNAGYLRFEILSSDVRVDAINGDIKIDIFVFEGQRYSFGATQVQFTDTPLVADAGVVTAAQTYVAGELFSDRLVERYRAALVTLLRDQGYAFAQVTHSTTINDDDFSVDINYQVLVGSVVEVRNISFRGNNITHDDVLRLHMELLEGELFSEDKLEYSLTRLRRTNYLLNAQAREIQVAPDLVDIEVEVQENSEGTFLFGVGYSSNNVLSFSVNFKRNNILGTGNDLRLNARIADNNNSFDAEFHQANITDSGISRTFGLSLATQNPSSTTGTRNSYNRLSSRLGYRIPINREWSWHAGVNASKIKINNYASLLTLDVDATTQGIQDRLDRPRAFVERYGDSQLALVGRLGLNYDTRDSAIDTKSGTQGVLSFEHTLPPSDALYYKLKSNVSYFRLLTEDGRNQFNVRGNFAYGDIVGNHIFPFYEREQISSSSVRGFSPGTLGIIDRRGTVSTNVGGRLLLVGNVEAERRLKYFDGQSVRIGAFADIGGLWEDFDDFSDKKDKYRASIGVLLKIKTPVLPLSFSYAIPLKKQDNDVEENFQFNFGF